VAAVEEELKGADKALIGNSAYRRERVLQSHPDVAAPATVEACERIGTVELAGL